MGKPSIVISLTSAKPIYRQIEDEIKQLIVSGELTEGAELPSIRALAQDLRISVITVKRAYDELEAQGFSSSVPGKGCYVSARNKELFREQRFRMVEQKLDEAVADARLIGMTLEELTAALTIIYEEEGNGRRTEG